MSEMWAAALAELLALERKIFRKLNETIDITRELAEAVDREDQVSVQMLLSNRQMPLLELQELNAAVDLKRCDLSGEDEESFDWLIVGGGEPETPEEKEVADQLALNRRVLTQLAELDQRVNEKLCREKSLYRKR